MNTSDELIELKLEQLREIGKQHAEAKKNLVYLEHARKILLARLMKEYQLNNRYQNNQKKFYFKM